MPIPITKPLFGPEEAAAIQKPLENGWVVQGPFVAEFEQKFSAFTQAHQAIATTSCTTALHLAVAILALKPGDEVIVPAFTWVSTANVVEYMGAKPIFCDINLATFNLDVTELERHITPQTVGIIPVHLFGLCANMTQIMEIAKHHNLWVVEDAACAFGSWHQGQHAGTFGDMGCFSFHPRKSITTGEGGMITTQTQTYAEQARSLRDHGASRTDLTRHQNKGGFLLAEYNMLGYNYRMTDIQGALGSVQMDRADSILAERQQRASHYDQQLADLDWLQTPTTPDNDIHGYQAYVCLFTPEKPTMNNVDSLNLQRNRLMQTLEEQGIATRQGTHAPVNVGYYRDKYNLQVKMYPNAYLAEQLSLALPLYAQMTDDEQAQVVTALKEATV